jgi:hypothetical protein
VIAGLLAVATPALAQTDSPAPNAGPERHAGERRYSFSPSGDGFVRLDSVTGQVSYCAERGVGWACQAAPEERAALESEIARLQDQNAALNQQLAASSAERSDRASPEKWKDHRPLDQPLLRWPTGEDVDRAFAFAGQVWRRLVDMMNDIQKDMREKI